MIQAELQGSGLSANACQAIAGSKALTVTAAGSTQATATALAAAINVVTTCTATANGVLLPVYQPGDSLTVCNATSVNLFVYPPVGGKLSGGTANVPYCMAPNSTEEFFQIGTLDFTT